MSSLILLGLWAPRLSMTTTRPGGRLGASTSFTYASKTRTVVAPSTVRDGPIPSKLMLESNVVFLPRLLWALEGAIARL
jgi:hypothetical protein